MSLRGQALPSSLCHGRPVYGRGKALPHNKGLSATRSLNIYEFGAAGKKECSLVPGAKPGTKSNE